MKQLLAAQELVFPRLFASLQAAMKPLMSRNTTGLESNRYTCVVMAGTVAATTVTSPTMYILHLTPTAGHVKTTQALYRAQGSTGLTQERAATEL